MAHDDDGRGKFRDEPPREIPVSAATLREKWQALGRRLADEGERDDDDIAKGKACGLMEAADDIIDLTALASQAAAPAVPVERVLEMAKEWRAETHQLRIWCQHRSGCDVCAQKRGEALAHEQCAAALEALAAKGGDGEG